MSKKDGTLFSRALFGYKRSDVNDYIKRLDYNHCDQIALLQSENQRLLERALKAEARIEELEISINAKKSEDKSPRKEKVLDSKSAEVDLKHSKTEAQRKRAASSKKRGGVFGFGRKK